MTGFKSQISQADAAIEQYSVKNSQIRDKRSHCRRKNMLLYFLKSGCPRNHLGKKAENVETK